MSATTDRKPASPDFWVGLFMPVILAAIIVPVVLVRAWVITVLWHWYVVPAFGLAPLRMVYAFGLSLLVNHLKYTAPVKQDEKGWANLLGGPLLATVMTLIVGWIGTWFL